jgi:hypothetical protein
MESCRELKENNPYLFNSWRSILYTEKGRKAGVVDEWRKFPTFYKDVHETYKEGLRLCRKDKNKPFGPNNFEWVTNLELAQTNTQTIKLTYNGEMNLASSNYTSTVDDLYIGTFSRGIQAYVWKGALYALDIYDRTLNSDELQIALQNIEK